MIMTMNLLHTPSLFTRSGGQLQQSCGRKPLKQEEHPAGWSFEVGSLILQFSLQYSNNTHDKINIVQDNWRAEWPNPQMDVELAP